MLPINVQQFQLPHSKNAKDLPLQYVITSVVVKKEYRRPARIRNTNNRRHSFMNNLAVDFN